MSIFQVARRFLLMRRLAAATLLGVLLSLSTVTSVGAKHDFLCELFSTHPCPQHPPKSTPPPPPIVTPTPSPAVAPVPSAPNPTAAPPLPSASPPVSVLPDAAMGRP